MPLSPDIPPAIRAAITSVGLDPTDATSGATRETWRAFSAAFDEYIAGLPPDHQAAANADAGNWLSYRRAMLYCEARDRLLESAPTLEDGELAECIQGILRMRESLRPCYNRLQPTMPSDGSKWQQLARSQLLSIFQADDGGEPITFTADEENYLRQLREELDNQLKQGTDPCKE